MISSEMIVYLSTFIAVFIAMMTTLFHLYTDQRVESRIEELKKRRSFSPHLRQEDSRFERLLGKSSFAKALRSLQPTESAMERKQKRYQLAGLTTPRLVRVFEAVRSIGIVTPFLAASLLVWLSLVSPTVTLVGAGFMSSLAMFLTSMWLDRSKRRRQATLTKAIPDMLDLVITCLDGGQSLEGSIRRVTSELQFAHPLLATELTRVQMEVDLGSTLENAMGQMADRFQIDSLRSLASFLQQSKRFGATIGEALRAHAEDLREQREFRAEELAQKASVKILLPTLLLIFPSVFVVLAGPAVIQMNRAFAKQSSET